MSVQVKCDDIGCDKCKKGILGGNDGFGGKLYYCQVRSSIVPKSNAKDCILFKCKDPGSYSCKSCRSGKL